MKLLTGIVAALLLCPLHVPGAETSFFKLCAYCGIYGDDTITSESGQFVVHGSHLPLLPRQSYTNNPAHIELNSQLAAVSAERTRRLVLRQLQWREPHRAEIHISLLNRVQPDYPIQLVTHVYSDGFHYQLGLPGRVENTRMVRGFVQALLLEFSNRSSRRSAELPAWLVEGMTQQVLSELMPAYVGNRKPLTRETLGYDPLFNARTFFATNACLTIDELSFFQDAQATPVQRLQFEHSSQLMVHELLRLPGGPQLLQNFLRTLPGTLNWQTAFYHVYSAHFKTPLALSKWWMLTWVDLQNSRAHEVWPLEMSLQKLEATLVTALETRLQTNSLPTRRLASLQEFISETPFRTHKDQLAEKVQQIFFLAYQLAPDVAGLAGEYQESLKTYLDRRALVEYQPALRSDLEARKEQVTKTTLQALDQLDGLRADLKAGRPIVLPSAKRAAPQASR